MFALPCASQKFDHCLEEAQSRTSYRSIVPKMKCVDHQERLQVPVSHRVSVPAIWHHPSCNIQIKTTRYTREEAGKTRDHLIGSGWRSERLRTLQLCFLRQFSSPLLIRRLIPKLQHAKYKQLDLGGAMSHNTADNHVRTALLNFRVATVLCTVYVAHLATALELKL